MTAASAAPRARADWPALLNAASAPYREAGRFSWRFARGKLGLDPVFRHLLREGLIKPNARVLDIGCGQGLLASLLRIADGLDARHLGLVSGINVIREGTRIRVLAQADQDIVGELGAATYKADLFVRTFGLDIVFEADREPA